MKGAGRRPGRGGRGGPGGAQMQNEANTSPRRLAQPQETPAGSAATPLPRQRAPQMARMASGDHMQCTPTPNSSPMRACPGRTLPSAGPATGVQWPIGQPQQCPLGANTREGLAGMRKTKQGMGEVGPGGSRVEIRPEGLQRCLLSPQGSNPPERSAFLSPLGTQAGRCTPPSGVLG